MDTILKFIFETHLDNFTDRIRHKNIATLVIFSLVVGSAFLLLKGSPPLNLAHGANMKIEDFNRRWINGDIIALVRHVERCDHSNAPCLDSADGITTRGRDVALELGNEFQKLGLEKTDIYSSPLTRAAQTSTFMFNHASSGQDWLFNCKGTMLRDVLRHKVNQHNLLLVTHSECIAEFEKAMKLPTPTPGYGSSLFISIDKTDGAPHVLGYIDAQDWQSVNQIKNIPD